MKHFYRLLNYECSRLLSHVLIIGLGMLVLTVLFIKIELTKYTPYSPHERFEQLFISSGGPIIFLFCFILLLIVFSQSLRAPFIGGKSIYTFLTLPVKREYLYFSKLAAFAICTILLLAVQFITYMLGYSVMESHISSYSGGSFVMNNGLFLSIIRSNFMRIIWPFSFLSFINLFSVLSACLTGLIYASLVFPSKNRWGRIPVAVLPPFLIRMVAEQWFIAESSLLLPSLILLVFSLFFIAHSLWLFKKGAVA